MFTRNPLLKEPVPSASLWRYMDFTKLLALLETNQLHFAPLIKFADPFEGHPPRSVVMVQRTMPFGLTDEEYTRLGEEIESNLKAFRDSRNLMFASCWHMNEIESSAMWSLYLRSGEGIAIRTTFEKVVGSLSSATIEVTGGMVDYVDYETFSPKQRNMLAWATYKRISFEHEREFRLLVVGQHGHEGILVPVKLSDLIDSIYLSPTMPDWIEELVTRVVRRYGLTCPIVRSALNSGPDYYDV